MYFKFIKLIVLLSLLVCCGFAGRVLYGRFPQLCRTRERSTSQMLGDNYFRLTDCFACFLAAAKCDKHVISVPFF